MSRMDLEGKNNEGIIPHFSTSLTVSVWAMLYIYIYICLYVNVKVREAHNVFDGESQTANHHVMLPI